jgi:hypothetical protein
MGMVGKDKLLGESSRKENGHMSDATNTEFASEELLSQAQGNATAMALTAIAFLKERNIPADEFTAYVGRSFALGWEELRGQGVKDVARMVALNMVSVGASLRSLSGDDTHAEVLIAGWPDNESLSELGLTQSDSEVLWNLWEPIMEYLGISYAWQRHDEAVKMSLKREITE